MEVSPLINASPKIVKTSSLFIIYDSVSNQLNLNQKSQTSCIFPDLKTTKKKSRHKASYNKFYNNKKAKTMISFSTSENVKLPPIRGKGKRTRPNLNSQQLDQEIEKARPKRANRVECNRPARRRKRCIGM